MDQTRVVSTIWGEGYHIEITEYDRHQMFLHECRVRVAEMKALDRPDTNNLPEITTSYSDDKLE